MSVGAMSVGAMSVERKSAAPSAVATAEGVAVLNDRYGSIGKSSGTVARLFDLAKTYRSQNAGVDRVTFDVIFADRTAYERRRGGAISREASAGYSA